MAYLFWIYYFKGLNKMTDKFQKGDIVELRGYNTFSLELNQKIPLFGIVYSIPHGDYLFYNVYCKDINPDHFNQDLVVCSETELR